MYPGLRTQSTTLSLFKQTQSRLLSEAFSHAAINDKDNNIHKCQPLSVAMDSFIWLSKPTE